MQRIGKKDVSIFTVQYDYGTHTKDWPTRTIVLSTVAIYYTKLGSNSVPQDYELTLKGVHKNKKNGPHAESLLLADLEKEIGDLDREEEIQVKRIEVHLVQNYSPCNNKRETSGCADDILTFKDKMSTMKINFSLTITFANFYQHGVFANRKGLIHLLQSGIKLELLQGKDKWAQFLSDKTFVNLTDDEYDELLAQATSNERKDRERKDREFLGERLAIAGEQMAKVYILIYNTFLTLTDHLHTHMTRQHF